MSETAVTMNCPICPSCGWKTTERSARLDSFASDEHWACVHCCQIWNDYALRSLRSENERLRAVLKRIGDAPDDECYSAGGIARSALTEAP